MLVQLRVKYFYWTKVIVFPVSSFNMDPLSLFTSMVVLLLNKFIYVIIVDYLPLGRLGNYVINDITFT